MFSTALVTLAIAVAPHISAPAPHVSVPAPHVSAPAPHVSAPAPRVSAPAPKVSTPPRATPAQPKAQTGSKTAPAKPSPRSSTYNGRTYYSTSHEYTNINNQIVLYWLLFVNPQNHNKKELRCFDKDHFRITCNDKAPRRH